MANSKSPNMILGVLRRQQANNRHSALGKETLHGETPESREEETRRVQREMLLDVKNCSVQQKPPSVAQEQNESYLVQSVYGSFHFFFVGFRTDTESSSHETVDEVEW